MTLVGRDPALAKASAVADMSREEERLASMRGSARIIDLFGARTPSFQRSSSGS